jgi:prevent-host-death family protein
MAEVTVRDLRNHAGEVVDRVAGGEHIVVTRDGRPVAELRPIPRPAYSSAALLEDWRTVPAMDLPRLRLDIDDVIDPAL